nr:SusC/RagA family TonB-linked outer membrane protein [uncultured Draconibacterium sp.]
MKLELETRSCTLKEFFEEVEANSEFSFFYVENEVDENSRVSINANLENFKKLLQDIANQQMLHFKVINDQIVVKNAKTDKSEVVEQEVKTITGKVTDSSGQALPGVSIIIKGTTVGVTSDSDGNFLLNVPVDSRTLVFSFIGMKTQEVPILDKTTIDVSMSEESVGMEEVVVTALGIEKSKRTLTYATQKVNMDNLSIINKGDVGAALAGKVAGVAVMTGSNGGSRIIIRGERSIAAGNQPLVIIDGVPSQNGMGNPEDIESLNVLKGPSASALYGAVAANGVVIITTKKGKRGEPVIEVNSQTMFDMPYLYPDMQNTYGQGEAGVYNANSAYYSWGPKMEGQIVSNFLGNELQLNPQKDNIKDLFRTGYSMNNSVSYSTGNEKATAYFSYKNSLFQGLFPNNSSTTHRVNMRMQADLLKGLKMDAVLTWVHGDVKNKPEVGDNMFSPMWQLVKMPRSMRTKDIEDGSYYDATGSRKQLAWAPNSISNINPYWALDGREAEETNNNVNAVASLKYDITDWIYVQARGRMAFNNGNSEQRYYWDTPYIGTGKGRYALGYSKNRHLNGDILLGIAKDISEDWHFNANFGAEIRDTKSSNISSTTGDSGLTIENSFYLGNGGAVTTSNSATHIQNQAIYATAQLGFKDHLFLDVTARNDWSSTLPSPYSYFYPSVGLTGVISDMVDLPEVISYLKLRGSYAEVGNGAGFAQIFQTYSRSLNGNQGQVSPNSTKVADDLVPEKTKAWEVGAEVRVVDDRIGLDFTGYKTNTYNQLVSVTSPYSSGYSSAFINCGNIQNKGIEIMFKSVPIQTTSIKWDLNINFSRNWSNVIELTETLDSYEIGSPRLSMGDNWLIVGEPYGEIYTRGFVRNDEGRIIVDDLGMPSVSSSFDYRLGNFNYDFRSGLTSDFQYKNWNLYFLVDLNYGGVRQSSTEAQMMLSGTSKASLYGREGFIFDGVREVVDGEGNVTGYIENDIEITAEAYGKSVGGRANTGGVGEIFNHSATNSRLRELSIGYEVPINSSIIKNLTISAVGKNLFYIYNACNWFDPDITYDLTTNGQGTESAFLPGTRSIGFNIELIL